MAAPLRARVLGVPRALAVVCALVGAAVAGGLALSGCGSHPPTAAPPTTASPVPGPTAVASSTADAPVVATADAVRAASPAARPGLPAAVERLRRPAAATVQPDGSVVLDWAAGPAEPLTVLLAAPVGGALDVHPDGSVVVRDAAGRAVGGVAPVAQATLAAPAPDLVTVTAAPGAGLALRVSDAALASATWGEREGGRSLAVVPADWARTAGEAGLAVLQAQLVVAVPEADTATMRDQLACHAVGAPDKARWNLEPWRPDVGLLATMAARCNP